MRIRISDRAFVSPTVKDFIVDVSKERMALEVEKIVTGSRREAHLENNAPRWHRMANGDVDKIIGTMHGLPYERIETIEYGGKKYIAGVTRDITMLRYNGAGAMKPNAEYDIGRYMVCVPSTSFINGTFSGVHLIPMRDPLVRNRHPHHTGLAPNYNSENPLDMDPNTCSGTFGSIAMTLAYALDFAETMRTWVTFLSRYDRRSPLCSLAPFMEFVRSL